MTIVIQWWVAHWKQLTQKVAMAVLVVVLEYLLTTIAHEEG